MKVFLAGTQQHVWREELGDFLTARQIKFFDPLACAPGVLSIFKCYRILETCDAVIACLANWEPQHLEMVLEVSYASLLAKEIMLVDDFHSRKSWPYALPYTTNFASLDRLKDYLTTLTETPQTSRRLFG